MANSNFRGPVNSMGPLELQSGTAATIEPQDGPSILYQGSAMPDPRFSFNKDQVRGGLQPSWANGIGSIMAVDQIPQAASTTLLSAAQVGTSGTAISLATTQVAGVASSALIAVGVPIIPVGTTVATTVIALDFGFTTGTTAAASTTVVVVDNRLFRDGQWIIIGGAGNAAAQLSHICQVASISTTNTTTITISPAAVTAIANAPIGQANLFESGLLPAGSQLGPAAASANAHSYGGAFTAGVALAYNPRETVTRTISMTGVTALTYSAYVQGYDLYGYPMAEVISLAAQTTTMGKKAFKYIRSITSGTNSGTQQLSFGLADSVGVPLRMDTFSEATVRWNNTEAANSNGYNFAATSTANSTSGDVRGSIQLSTAIVTGGLATAVSGVATNGTGRVSIVMDFTPTAIVYTNPNRTVPLLGVPQNTATT